MRQIFVLMVSDLTILIGGYFGNDGNSKTDTVEVVGFGPNQNNVIGCSKVLNRFPTQIVGAVGTTFGAFTQIKKEMKPMNLVSCNNCCLVVQFFNDI